MESALGVRLSSLILLAELFRIVTSDIRRETCEMRGFFGSGCFGSGLSSNAPRAVGEKSRGWSRNEGLVGGLGFEWITTDGFDKRIVPVIYFAEKVIELYVRV